MKTRLFNKLIFLFLLFTFTFLLEATATVRYVSKTGSSVPPYITWLTASDSIQKCINISQSGDTVYVANGVYKEQIVMIPGLSLIGSGMDSCIIDTEEFAVPTDFYAITLKDSCDFSGFQVIVSNAAYGTGVLGIDILDSSSIFSQNHIRNASTGMLLSNINFSISENQFSNTGRSIRFDCFTFDYFPVIDNNIILYPSSQAIFDFSGCQPIITNNIIYLNNQYSRGLEFIVKTPLSANNIIIAEAEISRGYTFTLDGNVRNNLLIGHAIGDRAFHLISGNYQAINNLIMNTSKGASIYGSVSMDFRYNNIWNVANPYSGFSPDSTNLSVDPMIVSEDSGNVHLQMHSPMIDAGDPQILDADGSRSDIGAYGGPLGKTYEYIDLPPRSPRGIISAIDSGLVSISWKKNTEADFHKYRVYRDTTQGFALDTTRLMAEISDTLFEENISNQPNNLYYKITAVDSQGNESAVSEEISIIISDVDEPVITLDDYHLFPNYPNPFNSTTRIGYRIKETSYVKLIVYDIKGEIVKILTNGTKEGGYYEEEFSAKGGSASGGDAGELSSGIYIYRLYVRNSNDIPVYSASGKMLYLK